MTPMPSGTSTSFRASRISSRSSSLMRRETPPAPGIVRHQDDEPAGEADEGGEGGALGAALFLLDLDDDVLAFAEDVADIDPAVRARLG